MKSLLNMPLAFLLNWWQWILVVLLIVLIVVYFQMRKREM